MSEGNIARNPSPPPISGYEADVLHSDTIGNTVFSKRWVLGVLVKLSEAIQQDEDSTTNRETENCSEDGKPASVSDTLDDELCKVWDMSMNEDVAYFLQEIDSIDILLEVIIKSSFSRLTEICIGILANMACQKQICVDMSNREKLIQIMTMVLDNRDAPTLVEATRLMHACISNSESRSKWVESIKNSSVFENLVFMLENSLNDELLLNCSLLMSSLLKHSETLLEVFDQQQLNNAVREAFKQTKDKNGKTAEALLYLEEMISSS